MRPHAFMHMFKRLMHGLSIHALHMHVLPMHVVVTMHGVSVRAVAIMMHGHRLGVGCARPRWSRQGRIRRLPGTFHRPLDMQR